LSYRIEAIPPLQPRDRCDEGHGSKTSGRAKGSDWPSQIAHESGGSSTQLPPGLVAETLGIPVIPDEELVIGKATGTVRAGRSHRTVSGLSAQAVHCQTMGQQGQGKQIQPEILPRPETIIDSALAGNSAELVERIRSGDAFVWRELVDQHEPLLRRIASQYRLSRPDADDVVQITWLRCLEHIDQLTHADRFRSWLATICRRECLRLATRGRREVALGETAVASLIDSNQAEQDASTEAAHREDNARLNRAITALPDRQRVVLLEVLKREGDSYLDISRRLNLPVGSIGPTWQRAVIRLRRDPELADLSPAS
jgi:RNA polymerase sigma factor (sigma-70 family)